jgi:hypothetical protein
MLLLLASLAFADDNAAAIGLAGVPETPLGVKPAGTHAERMAAIRAGERPDMLVPFRYEDRGRAAVGHYWHDGHGNVWTRAEVLAILQSDAASAEAGTRARRLESTATALILAADAVEIVGLVVFPFAPPVGALLIGGDALLLGGGGLTVYEFSNAATLDAAKAYNLAHAPTPELPNT